jgi:hypothetical protein
VLQFLILWDRIDCYRRFNIPEDCAPYWDVYIICIYNVVILSDYYVTIKNELSATLASLGSEVVECSVLFGIIGRMPVIQPSCKSMNLVNSGSVPATTGRVHATTGRVYATIGRMSETVGRVTVTVGWRRGEIVAEYHICLMTYKAKPFTSDMFHRWIRHVQ